MKSWRLLLGLELLLLAWPAVVVAYPPEAHQEMTFLAARQLNHCLMAAGEAPITALQVRNLALANLQMADRSAFARMFRWNYYASVPQVGRALGGLVDTRFEEHFNELVDKFGRASDERARLKSLGRMVFYLQRVTTPHRVVPVFSQRFWRLSFSDRFDAWDLDRDRLVVMTAEDCEPVLSESVSPAALLESVAQDTLAAVRSQISGLPVTWEAFWKTPDNPGDFGQYGPAGNQFGDETEFDCADGERCILLDKDPLYREFAVLRHAAAIRATMQAMMWLRVAPAAPTVHSSGDTTDVE